jgi:hypothetical protein
VNSTHGQDVRRFAVAVISADSADTIVIVPLGDCPEESRRLPGVLVARTSDSEAGRLRTAFDTSLALKSRLFRAGLTRRWESGVW